MRPKVTLLLALWCGALTTELCAQGSAFTYQGRLMENGAAFNGTIELEATLWDEGTNGTQILTPQPVTRTVQATNGLFSVSLDFGKAAFTGAQRWLQIHLRTSPDPAPFTTLWPRQKITATPHAMVAEQLTGPVPGGGLVGAYSNAVAFDNAGNYFAGQGSALLNLNASQLASGVVPLNALSNAWKIGGNSGTTPGAHFLGTTDNQALDLRVNGARALRLEPVAANDAVNVVAGSGRNFVANGTVGATISGGGTTNYYGSTGPYSNSIYGDWSTIGGGMGNRIRRGIQATIGGGFLNTIQTTTDGATIGGGHENLIQNLAVLSTIGGGGRNIIETNARYGTISGGFDNRILPDSQFATVPGGRFNSATTLSLAAGYRAKANHDGTFIWADSTDTDFASSATNEFAVRAHGGARFVTGGAGMTLDGQPVLSGLVGAAQLAPGAVSQLGTPDGSQTGAVQVINGGLVGIGTNAPGAGLHITTGASFLSPKVLFQSRNGIGTYTNPGVVEDVAISGNLLAFSDLFENAVVLMDISIPATPVFLTMVTNGMGVFTNMDGVFNLALSGGLLAVSAIWDDTVTLIDVSTPGNPTKLAELHDGVGGFNYLRGAPPMTIGGNVLAIANSQDDALTLVDVSNPAAPALSAVLQDGQGDFNDLGGPKDVVISGTLMVVLAETDTAVNLIDISNPANPILRAVLKDGVNGFDKISYPAGIALSGNLLAVAAVGDDAVTLVDVSNPANPLLVAVIDSPAGLGGASRAALSGNLLAVTARTKKAIWLADITNPAKPLLRGIFRDAEAGLHMGTPSRLLFAGGNLAVVSMSLEGLTLLEPVTAEVSLATVQRVGIGTTTPAAPLHVVGSVVVNDAENVDLRANHIGLGYNTAAEGNYSIAMGADTVASGHFSTAIGRSTIASGHYSTAMGFGGRANGHDSIAMGNGVLADGFTSLATGFGTAARGDYSLSAGTYAKANHAGTFVWADSTTPFAGFASSSSNQFLVRATGGVGINTTAPENPLTVEGIGTTNGGVAGFPEVVARVKRTGASHSALSIDSTTGRDAVLYLAEEGYARWAVRHDSDQSHELDIRYSAPGMAVGVEALKLTTNGNLIVAGTISGTIASNAIASPQILDGSVAAADVDALSFSGTFWKTDGNAGTTPETHFIGTTDNQPLEFKVNGVRALRLEPGVSGMPNVIGGAANNQIAAGVFGATISGGRENAIEPGADAGAIGGGRLNSIQTGAVGSVVGGGRDNTVPANATFSTVAGGTRNTAGGINGPSFTVAATVGGGDSNFADAPYATIGGGVLNTNTGFAATIPGGRENVAAGNTSFAAGRRAKANHTGAFVWADSNNPDFASTGDNQFLIRAGGGVGIGTPAPQGLLHLYGTNNPAVVRIQSAGRPGFGRLEFLSDPQGDINEWRPGYIQSTDNGNFTGGLGFFVNGSEHQNRLNSMEVMRLVNGRAGINITNPLHQLHVGRTLGTNAFSTAPNAIVVENALENGRAAFLALAGIGGPDTTNRVEVQVEASEGQRQGIIGTTTEHRVQFRIGNSEAMVLNTNRFVGIGNTNPTNRLMVVNARCDGATWINASDRNLKENFTPVNSRAVLEKVAALPIAQWNYKENPGAPHVGPVAQDFKAAFGLGADDTSIATVDADGVALAAIQGLNQKLVHALKQKETEIANLRQRLERLEQLLDASGK